MRTRLIGIAIGLLLAFSTMGLSSERAIRGTFAMVQEIPMPPPGNPEHAEPAPTAFCVHAAPGVTEAHACECQKKCIPSTDEEGNEDGGVWEVEDNMRCRAACHKKHCHCPSPCDP